MATPAYIIDILFLLIAPVHPSLAVIALIQYLARRSAFVCRGFATFGVVRRLPERVRLVLLPGLAPQSEDAKEETKSACVPSASATDAVAEALPIVRPVLPPPHTLTTEQWRDALDNSPHLLIYGPSKAGKSTLAQAIVAMFGECEYLVIDPMPNKPGEKKWGGIDFVTLGDRADEYAAIKAALAAVDAEDQRRRQALRTSVPRPLVVIIDEVLALVGELGSIVEDGRREPLISRFIRTKGYSARHRNIKIILIGQGKNLSDLGLNSSTARNNYALLRVARNPATDERSACIVTDDGEQPIDLSLVPRLAVEATKRARVWTAPRDGQTLERLLAPPPPGNWGDVPIHTGMAPEKDAKSTIHTGMAYRYGSGIPDIDASNGGMACIPPEDRDERIRLLVSLGVSANAIADTVRGDRNAVLARVRELRGTI